MKGYLTRKNKAWYIILEMERINGARKPKWISVRKELSLDKPATKAQAEDLLVKLLRDQQQGIFIEPHYMTMKDLLTEWMKSYGISNLRQTTYGVYDTYIRVHIIPSIGEMPIAKIKAHHLQRLYAQKLIDGRKDGKGLAPATVGTIHKIISRALSMAVKWELLARNVAELVDPPRIPSSPRKTWGADEAKKFLAIVDKHTHFALYLLAITTGMRKSEVLGLRWQDVDWDRNTISIVQAYVATSKGLTLAPAKTASGRRSVALSPIVMAALRVQRTEQAHLAQHLDKPIPQLVFTSQRLTPMNPNNLLRQFKALCKKAGVHVIPFHALRHTHATLMLQEGVHPKIVSERLGHSRVGVTMDVYSHVLPDMQTQAALTFDNLISKKG
jgi:integrase